MTEESSWGEETCLHSFLRSPLIMRKKRQMMGYWSSCFRLQAMNCDIKTFIKETPFSPLPKAKLKTILSIHTLPTSARAHTHTRTHTHTLTRTHTHTHTRTHARTHARTRARTHARTHTRTHARTHTHTHTHAYTSSAIHEPSKLNNYWMNTQMALLGETTNISFKSNLKTFFSQNNRPVVISFCTAIFIGRETLFIVCLSWL